MYFYGLHFLLFLFLGLHITMAWFTGQTELKFFVLKILEETDKRKKDGKTKRKKTERKKDGKKERRETQKDRKNEMHFVD